MSHQRWRAFRRSGTDLAEQQGNTFLGFEILENQLKRTFCGLQRISTVTAIEYCEIYILDFVSFTKYIQTNDAIMQKLTETAEIKLKLTVEAEEDRKKQLQEKVAESFD